MAVWLTVTLTTPSGGKRQRIKLATHMGEEGGVYVLGEPTIGAHGNTGWQSTLAVNRRGLA
jgi:excinuclease UvrABC ATPase subunit